MSIIICLKDYLDKKGRSQVIVRIKHKGFDIKKSTGLKVIAKYWDKRSCRVKNTHPNYKRINKKISELSHKKDALVNDIFFEDLSIDAIVSKLIGGCDKGSVFDFLESESAFYKPTTLKDYSSAMQTIQSHFGLKKLSFNDFYQEKNWESMRQKLDTNNRSKNTFNSYLKKAKSLHNRALRKGFVFNTFPHIQSNKQNEPNPKFLDSEELMQVINNLKLNSIKFKDDTISILIYLLMFNLRGLYQKDVEALNEKNFINKGLYDSYGNFDFKNDNKLYRHTRSKTGKIGLIYMGFYPITGIIYCLKTFLCPKSESFFPVISKNDYPNFWDYYSKRFKKITGDNFKSSRKAFQTIASIAGIRDSKARELLLQKETTITKYYKDFADQKLVEETCLNHITVITKYNSVELFNALLKKMQIYFPNKFDLKPRFNSSKELYNFYTKKPNSNPSIKYVGHSNKTLLNLKSMEIISL